MHSDETAVERRRIAYVINLTRGWRPDWGGLLHFADDEGNVVDTFFPHFNSLSLFTVPQNHFVSYVAPYAQGKRSAVTGWLIAA
jgi:Rps23 Pro-64 3,4-dihydroxylase Tpa1-like proline 4-hydroxylase